MAGSPVVLEIRSLVAAEVSQITGRNQRSPVEIRRVDQFELDQTVSVGSDIVLKDEWSLYCLDAENEMAVFVETPPEADLLAAPFLYAEQFATAERVAKVPFEDLPKLAGQIPPPRNLTILMSTGRCGSTLASRILSHVPGVLSISEPDWPTNLAFARFDTDKRMRDELIRACMRLTCKLPAASEATTVVIKPRSEMMSQAAAYVEALKYSQGVFLYRDCQGYVNSIYLFAQRVLDKLDHKRGSEEWELIRNFTTIGAPESVLDDYFLKDDEIGVVDLMTLGWVLRMRAYANASNYGMNVTPIHYSDLNADRETSTQRLLEACGVSNEYAQLAMKGYEGDSQAGLRDMDITKGEPLAPRHFDRISELLDRWGCGDYRVGRLRALGAG